MNKLFKRTPLVLVSAVLAACGGGGSDALNSGNISNQVSPDNVVTVLAGSSLEVRSFAVASSDSVANHSWTITQTAGTVTPNQPTVADANCARATVVPGQVPSPTGVSKDGSSDCRTVVVVPAETPAGEWRVENVARSSKASAADRFTLKVLPAGALDGGFALRVPTLPQAYSVGQTASIVATFTMNAGATLDKAPRYEWTQVSGSPVSLAGANTSTLSFVPRSAGEYVFKVKVTGELAGRSFEREGAVVVVAEAPEAVKSYQVSAGALQAAEANKVVTLKGEVTGDVPAAELSYQWSQVGGPLTNLFLDQTLSPQFNPSTVGEYVFELAVTRTGRAPMVKTSRTQVSVYQPQAQVPFFSVDAGQAQVVNTGSLVTLRGTLVAGSPAPTNPVYTWEQKSGPVVVSLSSATTPNASFVTNTAGVYEFVFTATANGIMKSDTVVVNVSAPTTGYYNVSAGDVQVKLINDTVTLQGTVSGTVPAQDLVYTWSQVSGPASVPIFDGQSLKSQFRPAVKGDYVFELSVARMADPSIKQTSRTLVAVYAPADAPNEPFFAVSAGDAQVVEAGKVATLDGSLAVGSPAPSNVTYKWTFVTVPEGAQVIVSNDETLRASFIPNVTGTYVLQLSATAGSTTKTAITSVQAVVALPPATP